MKQLKLHSKKGHFISMDGATSSIVGAEINTRRFRAGLALLAGMLCFLGGGDGS